VAREEAKRRREVKTTTVVETPALAAAVAPEEAQPGPTPPSTAKSAAADAARAAAEAERAPEPGSDRARSAPIAAPPAGKPSGVRKAPGDSGEMSPKDQPDETPKHQAVIPAVDNGDKRHPDGEAPRAADDADEEASPDAFEPRHYNNDDDDDGYTDGERRVAESAPVASAPVACETNLARTFGRSTTIDNRSPKKYGYVPIVGQIKPPKPADGGRKPSTVVELPPIKPARKVRVTDDPVVADLEKRVRERRVEQRKRQAEMEVKSARLQKEFEEKQAARAEDAHRRKMDELQRQREAQEERLKYYEEMKQQRIERLSGHLKVDADVLSGKKRLVDAFAERRNAAERAEVEERQRLLDGRKQHFATGKDYYRDLAEHERAVQRQHEEAEKERKLRAAEAAGAVNHVPRDFQTKAHREILTAEEEEKRRKLNPKESAIEKRQAQLAYAEEVKRNHMPHVPAPPPKESKKQRLSQAFEQIGQRKDSKAKLERQRSGTNGGGHDAPAAEPEMNAASNEERVEGTAA
jgi:hypothetical protein